MLKTYPVTINIYSAANTVNKTGLPNAYKCIPRDVAAAPQTPQLGGGPS